MLNPGVFSLGVLADQDGVDVVVSSLVPGNRAARTNIGKEVEGTAEGQVEGDVALADGGLGFRSVSLPGNKTPDGGQTARGPLRATRFFLTELMALSGIAVLPSLMIGVTSTGSHSMGACVC